MAKILVVEDENIVAWDIKETLEKLGHTVLDLVVSGAAALGSAAEDKPDLVLMDIRLDGEMDGIEAGDEIYRRLNIPVVYLTAHADELTLARATRTDPFGYIIKPFQPRSLQSTIKIALQRHKLEESAYVTQACLVNTLNSIGDGIIATDRQGLVTFINAIAQELTGWDAGAAMGVEIDRIFRLIWETDGTAIENPSSRAMRLKEPVKSPDRCWLVAKDGLETPISDTATPIVKPDGEIIGSIVVFQDNTERLSIQMDLWEQNKDLEFFQRKLTSELETKTIEYHQAIVCIQILDLVLKNVGTIHNEQDLLQIAIEQLGIAIDADYCWCTIHDDQSGTANIVCEYINREQQIYPTSKIGKEIDILLYPEFYNHLFESESWIDPPLEILPQPYLDLVTATTQSLICPLTIDLQGLEYRSTQGSKWTIGEVGILTTANPQWTTLQTNPIAQVLSCAVKLFRQTRSGVIDAGSIAPSIKWLNSLKDNLSGSIADTHRDLHRSAEILHQQIHSLDDQPEDLAVIRHHQELHHQLAANLDILQGEWQRQFKLIDILIDLQVNDKIFQIKSLSDTIFCQWLAVIVESCGDLAAKYKLDFSYQVIDQLMPISLCSFPILELMILELFNNACKYTPPDRSIILDVDITDNQLQLSVISLGIEISADNLEAIFLPFARNSPVEVVSEQQHPSSGITGLGLALVKKLVPYLGGKIGATSDRNTTSLILTLPLDGDFPTGDGNTPY
jgi:PAS domain S-box-containing protein